MTSVARQVAILCIITAMVVCSSGCGSKPDEQAPSKQSAESTSQQPSSPAALRHAIEKGDVQASLACIAAGASVTEAWHGEQPLHMAARSGKKEILEAILAKGVDPKVQAQNGYTALHMAATRDVAELLLQRGLNVNQPATYRETPLCAAADTGNIEVVEFLLSRGADPKARARDLDVMPLNFAATRTIAEKLVAAGAPAWGETNQWGRNTFPIWTAASKGRSDVVAFLLEQGIPPPPKRGLDEYISKSFFNAVNGKHSGVVEVILNKVQNPDPKNCSNLLSYAAKKSDTNTVRVLLAKGPKPDDNYCELLTVAAERGDLGIMRMALAAGGNAATGSSTGYTPLHAAAAAKSGPKENYFPCVELLLANGANAKSATKTSLLTPLHLAAAANFPAAAKLLVQHGASVNATDQVSSAPIHWAVVNDALETAEFLLSNGANPNLALGKQASVQTTRPGEIPNPFSGTSVSSQVPLSLAKSEAMKSLLRKHGATDSASPAAAAPQTVVPDNTGMTVQPPKSAIQTTQPASNAGAKKVRIGYTESEVVEMLGSPKGRITIGKEMVMQYNGGQVTFVDGKVTEVSGQPSPK